MKKRNAYFFTLGIISISIYKWLCQFVPIIVDQAVEVTNKSTAYIFYGGAFFLLFVLMGYVTWRLVNIKKIKIRLPLLFFTILLLLIITEYFFQKSGNLAVSNLDLNEENRIQIFNATNRLKFVFKALFVLWSIAILFLKKDENI